MTNPRDRIWFYHTLNGWKGYLVEKDGKKFIKVQLVGDNALRPFSKQEWSPIRELRPLTPGHVAEIAFEADKILARALGERVPREGWKNNWLSLHPEEKRRWISGEGPGPSADPKRQELFLLLRMHFKDITV
jgi:hypothetical protein